MQNTVSASTFRKSVWAVVLGIIVNVAFALGTDQVLHWLNVYPPWGEPMNETSDNVLALGYRIIYGVLGGSVTAVFAPHSPMRHALIVGWIGVVMSSLGVIAASMMNLGPIWYPFALVVVSLPCAWMGSRLAER